MSHQPINKRSDVFLLCVLTPQQSWSVMQNDHGLVVTNFQLLRHSRKYAVVSGDSLLYQYSRSPSHCHFRLNSEGLHLTEIFRRYYTVEEGSDFGKRVYKLHVRQRGVLIKTQFIFYTLAKTNVMQENSVSSTERRLERLESNLLYFYYYYFYYSVINTRLSPASCIAMHQTSFPER